jgi:hypothetical protein
VAQELIAFGAFYFLPQFVLKIRADGDGNALAAGQGRVMATLGHGVQRELARLFGLGADDAVLQPI